MSDTDTHDDHALKPPQARALIQLAFLGGRVAKVGDLKPPLDAKLRKDLIEKKLLDSGPKIKGSISITLRDEGWRWTMDNLTAEMPKSERLSTAVLASLDKFLKVNGLTVQDVIQANRIVPEVKKQTAPAASAKEAVLSAALELGGGHITEQIRLRDLRPEMDSLGYGRASVDEAIRGLQLDGTLSVIPIDLPTDIDDRDRAAAIDVGGVPRHAIIVRRSTRSDAD